MTVQPAALGPHGLKTFNTWQSSPAAFRSPQSVRGLQESKVTQERTVRVGVESWDHEQPVHTILAGCVKHALRRHRINKPGSVLEVSLAT